MIGGKYVLAVIPARGGSKRLPRKNILDFNGKPLLSWTIQAGLQSNYVDKVIVSTEDREIAEVAKEEGADVPFLRPAELGDDTTTTIDVVRHLMKSLSGEMYDYILLLQPTSPLRTAAHIDQAVELLLEKNADAVIGVTEVDHPVEWTNVLPDDLSFREFISQSALNVRSQDLPCRYRINGALYLVDAKKLDEQNTFFLHENSYAFIMDKKASVDIDDEMDFVTALTLQRGAAQTQLRDRFLDVLLENYQSAGGGEGKEELLDRLICKFAIEQALINEPDIIFENGSVDFSSLSQRNIVSLQKTLPHKTESELKIIIDSCIS